MVYQTVYRMAVRPELSRPADMQEAWYLFLYLAAIAVICFIILRLVNKRKRKL